jgi:hypothetical protein
MIRQVFMNLAVRQAMHEAEEGTRKYRMLKRERREQRDIIEELRHQLDEKPAPRMRPPKKRRGGGKREKKNILPLTDIRAYEPAERHRPVDAEIDRRRFLVR